VTFGQASGGPGYFQAYLNNRYYSCVVRSNATAVQALWPTALAHGGYFDISWTAAGECVGMQLQDSSAFQSY
jgi:hypothetical protein